MKRGFLFRLLFVGLGLRCVYEADTLKVVFALSMGLARELFVDAAVKKLRPALEKGTAGAA